MADEQRSEPEVARDEVFGLPPRGEARLIAVGGGRGGVGKSVIAESLAVYFAQLGKPVVLVDADPTGANLHSRFGLSAARTEPSFETSEAAHAEGDRSARWSDALVATTVPGLLLLPAPHDSIVVPTVLRASRKTRWIPAVARPAGRVRRRRRGAGPRAGGGRPHARHRPRRHRHRPRARCDRDDLPFRARGVRAQGAARPVERQVPARALRPHAPAHRLPARAHGPRPRADPGRA